MCTWKGHLKSVPLGRPAWLASVNSVCYRRVMDCPEGAPSLEGVDPWLCYGCLWGPFTPALFQRAGQELRVAGHSNLPPRSGISAPNHFQMAAGPLRTPPATAEPACQSAAAFILGESMLKEGFDLEPNYIWQQHPLPAQGPGSVL